MTDVFLFNTASRKKEKFQAISPPKVRLYTCGPTVYHFAHIGNLRTYVFEDLLVKTLLRAGFQIQHVMNITDVGHLVSDGDEGEDKMEKGARREGKSAWDIAKYYTDAFFSDFDKLRCRRPDQIPKATDHIKEMIELIQTLDKKKFIYKTADGIYYDTSKFPKYPDFAKLDVENLEAGARVAVGDKKHPTDFALWKFSSPDQKRQMEWDSPWGRGFPGWHIECSAMAMKYLGETFDIHCGGKDHIPVHHTNEIAQSEGATGKTFSKFWLHGEFLIENSGKMSKSAGEFLTLSSLEAKGFRPEDYRFLLLQAHYRSEIQFDFSSLQAAKSGYEGVLNRLQDFELEKHSGNLDANASTKILQEFDRHLFDDLNSPAALGVVFDTLRDAKLSVATRKAVLKDVESVLSLGFFDQLEKRKSADLPVEVQEKVRGRDEARKNKNWKESDRLRDELIKLGYRVDDTPQGTRVMKDS